MKKRNNFKSQTGFRMPVAGIQAKLFAFLLFLALIFSFVALYEFYSLELISVSSRNIIKSETPRARGIQEASLAMLEGQLAFDEALGTDDFLEIEEVNAQEADFNIAITRFSAYLAAVTWGSESEAFRKSNNGRNLKEWEKLGLEGNLIIELPSDRQAQLAGLANIYFGGFANNALLAIASHKEFLRLRFLGDEEGAAIAKQTSSAHARRAIRFYGFAIESLDNIIGISNTAIVASARDIEKTQQDVRAASILIFVVGFFLSMYGGLIFIREVVIRPLKSLMQTAQEISSGNLSVRAEIKSKDEIGMLARAFNEMADRLAEYPEELKKTVQQRTGDLVAKNRELDEIARALVQRDLELSDVRRKQEDQLIELDQVAKKLVRRDMALLKANDELLEIDKAKSHFVSIAAHQLRTPLSIIKWTFRMLVSGDFGPINKEQKRVIERGYEVNEGTIRLISDLLDVARIESGRFLYHFRYVSIEEIIKEAFDMHLSRAKERNIDFKLVKKSKGEIPHVFGDKSSLRMAINNLIANALKYTLQGGKVAVIYKKKDEFIEVRVRDTGVGVSKYQIGKLFTKFFRGDNVMRMQTSGTGLGLFIAQNIIKAHKGAIGVESKEGEGSEFWFTIPVKKL